MYFFFLRSSFSNGRPYCYSSVSFSLLFFFLTRFFQNAWTDFHEIFRDGIYWSRNTENNFSCDDVTSGLSYWRFPDFDGVILWRYLLRNESTLPLQIFTDDTQKIEVVQDKFKMHLDVKALQRGRTRKSSSKKRLIFLHLSSNNSFPENILL